MRRRAGGERRQQEAEAGIDVGRRQTQVGEDLPLDRRIGDPDRARTELVAVVDGVVVQRPAREGVRIELTHVFRMRGREGVMGKHGLPRFGIRLE